MLPSLHIKNYRNLKDFKIPALARVNLITGKNNTGKSSILEAIAIYASGWDIEVVDGILIDRGEFIDGNSGSTRRIGSNNIKSFSSLFPDRKISFNPNDRMSIGPLETSAANEPLPNSSAVVAGFHWYSMQRIENQGTLDLRLDLLQEWEKGNFSEYNVALVLQDDKNYRILAMEQKRDNMYLLQSPIQAKSFELVKAWTIDPESTGLLWDQIALTEKEDIVIDAIRIIEPLTERIVFKEYDNQERIPVVKVSNYNFPLRSMGDGINRILSIILAMVNCDDGYLLLDEFENGLHYSVQEQLWKIIFMLAEKLNVQVFATTHSEDSIYTFQRVLNGLGNPDAGKMIRLDNKNGEIKIVEFSAAELKIATERNIEIR